MELTIDGRHVAAEPGTTILQAARAAGIDDPDAVLPRRPSRPDLRLPPLRRRRRGPQGPGDRLRHAGRRRHGRHHADPRAARHPPAQSRAHPQRPHVVLHAALPRRLPDAHQDPRLPRAHRRARLRGRHARAAPGPAVPRHPRARVPAALRGSVPPRSSSTSPSPSASCTASWPTRRAPASRRASCCCRPSPSPTPARRSRSSAAGPPASPPPSTRASRATPSRSSRRSPSPAACCATASPATACRATSSRRSSTSSGAWASSCRPACASGVDFQLDDLRAEYDAVFLALGAFNANAMGCDGEDAPGVVTAVDFLGDLERDGTVAVRQEGHRHRRRLHRHGRLPHRRAPRRRRGHLPLPALAHRDARPPHRGRRGRGGGRALRAPGGAGARAHRRRRQGARHRDDPHGARRARRLRPPPPRAARGLRVRRRVRPGDQRHRPVPAARRRRRGRGPRPHALAHARRRRLDAADRRPQGLRRRRRRARRADRRPGHRPGQEGRLEHGRLPARRRHAARSRSELHDLRRTPFVEALEAKGDIEPGVRRMAEVPPVFIDINTGVAEISPPAHMPKLWPEDRKTNFEQIELGFPEDEAVRGAELCLQCTCEANGECELQRHGIDYEVFANRFQGTEARDYDARDDSRSSPTTPSAASSAAGACRVPRGPGATMPSTSRERGFDALVTTSFGRSMVETDVRDLRPLRLGVPHGRAHRQAEPRHGQGWRHRGRRHRVPVLRLRLQLRPPGQRRPGRAGHVPGRRGRRPGHPVRQGPLRHQFIAHPDRLTQPLIRRDGELEPATWDEALDLVAERFAAIKAEHGPDALAGSRRRAAPTRRTTSSRSSCAPSRHEEHRPLRAALPRQHGHRPAPVAGQRRDDQLVQGPRGGRRDPHHRLQHHRGAPDRRATHQAGAARGAKLIVVDPRAHRHGAPRRRPPAAAARAPTWPSSTA